jgi:hypothetical protein
VDSKDHGNNQVVDLDGLLGSIVGPVFGWPRGRDKPQSAKLTKLLRKVKRRV